MKKQSAFEYISLSENNGNAWKDQFPLEKIFVYDLSCNYWMKNYLIICRNYFKHLLINIHDKNKPAKLLLYQLGAKENEHKRKKKKLGVILQELGIYYSENIEVTPNGTLLHYLLIDIDKSIQYFEEILVYLQDESNTEHYFIIQPTHNEAFRFDLLIKLLANSMANYCDPGYYSTIISDFIKKLIAGKLTGLTLYFPFGNLLIGSIEMIEIEL